MIVNFFCKNRKLFFFLLLAALTLSTLFSAALAQQMQSIPAEKISFERIFKPQTTERLIVEDVNEKLYTAKGCKIIHRLEDALSIECPVSAAIPNAIKDTKLHMQNVDLPKSFKPSDVPNNDYLHIPQAWSQGYTGKNRIVAVVDTGVDYNHPSLSNHILMKKSFVSYTEDAMDDVGHGTAIAGIITGDGNPEMEYCSDGCETVPEDFSKGVAPDAKLMVAKVCGPDGCDVADIAAGIEWAVAGYDKVEDCFGKCGYSITCCKKYDGCSAVKINSKYTCTGTYVENVKPDVISLSLGSTATWINSNCDKGKKISWENYIAKKIDWAVKKGVPVVVATGNMMYGVASPACAGKAIAAGGLDWFVFDNKNYDAVWQTCYGVLCTGSGRGFAMKDHGVLAPWVAFSTVPGGYGLIAGTSVSAPHVAGLIALMKEKNPKLTAEQVRQTIFKTSIPLNSQQVCYGDYCFTVAAFQAEDELYEEGHGKIDAATALSAVRQAS